MNREIADAPTWGKQQIAARADQLAERMIQLWPAPLDQTGDEPGEDRDWSLLRKACVAIPAGSWTTYADLAELVGSHPEPVNLFGAVEPSYL